MTNAQYYLSVTLVSCLTIFGLAPPVSAEPPAALDLFQRRIVPILQAPNASSCAECHLSGVDLKQYIRPSQEQTFAALREAGLIDTKAPEKSKLLEFISRRPQKPSPVVEKVRAEEYAAFAAWIAAATQDPHLTELKASEKIGPQIPDEVIRHARRDQVLSSFIENVWSEVGRCAGCHSPDRNQEQVKKHGEQVSWIQLRDPEATLAHLVEYELIDLEHPVKSKLLTKPTNQVKHGGGVKLTVGDRTYTQFRRFLEDYAAVKAGRYKKAAELPAEGDEVSQVADIWLKLEGIPERYGNAVLRANLFAWDTDAKAWRSERVATGDRQIALDRHLWQQHLTLTARRGTKDAARLAEGGATLPEGKYLLKIYVDIEDNLAKKYPYELGEKEIVGQIEVTSRWPTGYGAMTTVKFPEK